MHFFKKLQCTKRKFDKIQFQMHKKLLLKFQHFYFTQFVCFHSFWIIENNGVGTDDTMLVHFSMKSAPTMICNIDIVITDLLVIIEQLKLFYNVSSIIRNSITTKNCY